MQETSFLSQQAEIFRIVSGMQPVTRDQVVSFIYEAMEAMGVTATELSRKAGLDASTLNKFLRNPAASDLSLKTITKISSISGLQFPKLSHNVQLPVAKRGQPRGSVDLQSTIPVMGGRQRDLPIYGEDQLGSMGYAFGDPASPTLLGYVERPADLTDNDRAYAVRVKDDSMSPRFRAGEMIFVDPTRPAKPGDEVMVRCKDGEGWVKRLVSRDLDGIRTDSYQPDGEATFPNEELAGIHVIVGVAVSR